MDPKIMKTNRSQNETTPVQFQSNITETVTNKKQTHAEISAGPPAGILQIPGHLQEESCAVPCRAESQTGTVAVPGRRPFGYIWIYDPVRQPLVK